MKKSLALITIILFMSCDKELNKEEKFRGVIEPLVIESMNDPKSYEFVSVTDIDTFLLKDSYSRNLKLNQDWLDDIDPTDSSSYAIKDREKYSNDIKYNQTGLDSVSPKTIDEIGVTFKYRGKNKMGGVVLDEKRFYFDDKMNITRVKE